MKLTKQRFIEIAKYEGFSAETLLFMKDEHANIRELPHDIIKVSVEFDGEIAVVLFDGVYEFIPIPK